MKKTINFSDLLKKDGYMSYEVKGFEICLEPCLNGCDVAIYDDKQDLLEPKVCTGLTFSNVLWDTVSLHKKSYDIMNRFYKKYIVDTLDTTSKGEKV